MAMEDGSSAGPERGEQHMVWCTCGEIILAFVGEGFVITLDDERRWMRRRSDLFYCHSCGRRHALSDLKDLALAGPASNASGA